MLEALRDAGHRTLGADKNYDTAGFVAGSRASGVTPHVAQNINAHRGSTSTGGRRDTRPTASAGSFASGSRRGKAGSKRSAAQTRLHGVARVEWVFMFKAAAYNLIRLPRLLARQWLSGTREIDRQRKKMLEALYIHNSNQRISPYARAHRDAKMRGAPKECTVR
jgi:hypothetical protein